MLARLAINIFLISKKIGLLLLSILCAGCAAASVPTPLPTPEFITATLPAAPTTVAFTPTPFASLQPNATPTPPIIISGTTTSELNVRADTFTASVSLGILPAFSAVNILGQDGSGLWYQISFNDRLGWIRSDYAQLPSDVEPPFVADSYPMRGVILRGVNVRNGAGQNFDSLGLLNQNDVIPVLAKDASAQWIEIVYPPAADGFGWVSAEFIRVKNLELVPFFGAESPTEITATATSSSFVDGDTFNAPLAEFVLSSNELRAVQLQGELSTLNGDYEDWARFYSEVKNIALEILCDSSAIQVELFHGETAAAPAFHCGESRALSLIPNQEYFLRISIVSAESSSAILKYELRVKIIH